MTDHKDIALSDKVRLSSLYLSNYCGIDHLRDQVAEVVGITKRMIRSEDLSKDERPLYVEAYGTQKEYPVIGMSIKYSDHVVLLVSSFGCVKI